MSLDDLFSSKSKQNKPLDALFETKAMTPLPTPENPSVIPKSEVPSKNKANKGFGNYEVLEEIAKGAMGIVYKVQHFQTRKIYALKLVTTGYQEIYPELTVRFQRETQIIMKLNHSGIVRVFDAGKERNDHYYVMEFIDGKPLNQLILQGLPWREGAMIVQKVLEALDYVHQQDILHRDIKPANIFVTQEGVPKLGDFGIAKDLLDSECLTRTGMIMGTPFYMPPELLTGTKSTPDIRSDIYAMGACLYEVLTRKCPFEGESLFEILNKIRRTSVLPPSKHNPEIPNSLEQIVMKALEKDPSKRYGSAEAFALDLRLFNFNH